MVFNFSDRIFLLAERNEFHVNVTEYGTDINVKTYVTKKRINPKTPRFKFQTHRKTNNYTHFNINHSHIQHSTRVGAYASNQFSDHGHARAVRRTRACNARARSLLVRTPCRYGVPRNWFDWFSIFEFDFLFFELDVYMASYFRFWSKRNEFSS